MLLDIEDRLPKPIIEHSLHRDPMPMIFDVPR